MGEYATLPATGEEIKIGTCEDMLYLRFDQRHQIKPHYGNVDPTNPDHLAEIRFRFPWPDEDQTPPGAFSDPFRRLALHVPSPPTLEHGHVQFIASQQGYNVCLPCPETPQPPDSNPLPYTVHHNGFPGPTFLVQQAVRNDRLVIICECVCGRRYNLPTLPDAEPYISDVLDQADRELRYGNAHTAQRLTEIARRMREGYNTNAQGETVRQYAADLEDAAS